MRIAAKLARRLNLSARRVLFSPKSWLKQRLVTVEFPLARLGTEYGGWHLVDDPALKGSVAVLCGAGEDISFDLALQARFGCTVLIVDPTPRAIRHFEMLSADQRSGNSTAINNSATDIYSLDGVDFARIRYFPVALWSKDDTLRFWEPFDPSHVSYSAVNLQNTNRHIDVPAKQLATLLKEAGAPVEQFQLLKLDIEGAEIPVLEQLCDSGLLPKQLLVELDELQYPTFANLAKIKALVLKLIDHGYVLAQFDGMSNCLFYRAETLQTRNTQISTKNR